MSEQRDLYNIRGKNYNVTRKADPLIANKFFRSLNPKSEGLYLDIGCGTGNYSIKLAEKGLKFWGVDPSHQMLQIAKERTQKVNWLSGSAEQIPASGETFDGAIAVLTIHHWTDIEKSFTEIFRVLKYNSRLILFTSTPEQMKGYWLNYYFPSMLQRSIELMPSFERIKELAEKTGLTVEARENYHIHDTLEDLFLYSGKSKPELYFDENIRSNISSFSVFSNPEEVEEGLNLLRNDIDAGEFRNIKKLFEDGQGDYLFIVMEKK